MRADFEGLLREEIQPIFSLGRTTEFYASILHVLCTPTAGIRTSMQSIDFKPTVGLLIGKHSCFDALNNKVSFHMHHHNVLSTEKGLLAVPTLSPSCHVPGAQRG